MCTRARRRGGLSPQCGKRLRGRRNWNGDGVRRRATLSRLENICSIVNDVMSRLDELPDRPYNPVRLYRGTGWSRAERGDRCKSQPLAVSVYPNAVDAERLGGGDIKLQIVANGPHLRRLRAQSSEQSLVHLSVRLTETELALDDDAIEVRREAEARNLRPLPR